MNNKLYWKWKPQPVKFVKNENDKMRTLKDVLASILTWQGFEPTIDKIMNERINASFFSSWTFNQTVLELDF